MVLGFKRQFHPHVRDGSKRHSIRAGHRWKVGMIADCFGDVRQKSMFLLGRWPVVEVENAVIYECGDGTLSVLVNGQELTVDEKNLLAWHDGFRPAGWKKYRAVKPSEFLNPDTPWQMVTAFWKAEHSGPKGVDFDGQIVHWDYDRPLYRNAKGKVGAARP